MYLPNYLLVSTYIIIIIRKMIRQKGEVNQCFIRKKSQRLILIIQSSAKYLPAQKFELPYSKTNPVILLKTETVFTIVSRYLSTFVNLALN